MVSTILELVIGVGVLGVIVCVVVLLLDILFSGWSG